MRLMSKWFHPTHGQVKLWRVADYDYYIEDEKGNKLDSFYMDHTEVVQKLYYDKYELGMVY